MSVNVRIKVGSGSNVESRIGIRDQVLSQVSRSDPKLVVESCLGLGVRVEVESQFECRVPNRESRLGTRSDLMVESEIDRPRLGLDLSSNIESRSESRESRVKSQGQVISRISRSNLGSEVGVVFQLEC